MPLEHRKCFSASATVWYCWRCRQNLSPFAEVSSPQKLLILLFMLSHRTYILYLLQKGVRSCARAIWSITGMQAPTYSLCCNTIQYYLSPHLLSTAQLCIHSFVKHDVGCGFVSWDKHVERLHVYLSSPSLILVSKETVWFPIWPNKEASNVIPNMASTAKLCWGSTSEHLFAEPCAVLRSPGRAGEHEPVTPRVWCDWMCCTPDGDSPACMRWTDSAPQCVWQQGTGAAGQGGSLVSRYLDPSPWAPASTHHWLPIQKYLAIFSHCPLSCYHAT